MANWLSVADGLVINLDFVKGIKEEGDRTIIFIELNENLDQVSVNLPFEVVKKILSKRGSADLSARVEEMSQNIRTLAKSAYTPTP